MQVTAVTKSFEKRAVDLRHVCQLGLGIDVFSRICFFNPAINYTHNLCTHPAMVTKLSDRAAKA